MPAHLTRLVFRSIIANEPLLYRGCRHRVARAYPLCRPAPCALPHIQRRPFLDLFKPRRKLKPAEVTQGLLPLSDLYRAQKNAFRPPKTEDIADGLVTLFRKRKGSLETFHIERAHNAFRYLLENPQDGGQPWLSAADLRLVYDRMTDKNHLPETGGSAHISFGKAILTEYARLRQTAPGQDQAAANDKLSSDSESDSLSMIRLLTLFGAATEARDIAAKVFPWDPQASVETRKTVCQTWERVLKAVIREADADVVRATTALMQDLSIPVTARMRTALVVYYSELRDLENAKFWYAHSVHERLDNDDSEPEGPAAAALLKACALSGDMAFGQQTVASLLKSSMPEKSIWDAVFVWSAAIGKGVDEVDRMMSVMVRRNDDARKKDPAVDYIRPDIDTINALVEFSISKRDPYSAERYITLGEKRGITPNEKTYTMQIQYRLSAKDYDGARAAYHHLQGYFTGARETVAVINQLIVAMCETQQHHFDELMVMVDDLRERNALFSPEAISALCVLHFRRGEDFDGKDLLQLYAPGYSPEQRRIIQKGLLTFILDGDTSTADAWDCYQNLRDGFQETPRDDRIRVMNEFFARKRPDMACHVFFHMRNHPNRGISANKDVYVAAFTGFARCADAESLALAHNQMKLDYNLDVDTRVRNSLMLAYACTGENTKALRFWREICESREGPTYNSIAIAFRACEGFHGGYEHAQAIWRRLIQQDVEIDKLIWLSYLRAVARNHYHDQALALIETVEEEYGFKPDLEILGNWFNMTNSVERQKHVEAWIKKNYPKVWEEFEALGHWVVMEGFGWRQYYLAYDLEP